MRFLYLKNFSKRRMSCISSNATAQNVRVGVKINFQYQNMLHPLDALIVAISMKEKIIKNILLLLLQQSTK